MFKLAAEPKRFKVAIGARLAAAGHRDAHSSKFSFILRKEPFICLNGVDVRDKFSLRGKLGNGGWYLPHICCAHGSLLRSG